MVDFFSDNKPPSVFDSNAEATIPYFSVKRFCIEISIIVPTYKEVANIPELVRLLDAALAGIAWEVIFVDDDSPDGSWRVAKDIALMDRRVRCIRRVGRRGLAGACIEGMLSSAAPVVAVMDADLQHDEMLLSNMYAAIRDGAELVVGSRYVKGGSSGGGAVVDSPVGL